MSNKLKPIIIEFEGGGFVVVDNPNDILIYINRFDLNDIKYVMLRGQMVPGDTITKVSGAASTRVRYV